MQNSFVFLVFDNPSNILLSFRIQFLLIRLLDKFSFVHLEWELIDR